MRKTAFAADDNSSPRVRRFLDSWATRVNTPEFIKSDPVCFPRQYSRANDIEVAAFLTATIAWGRRDLILRSAERMFGLMGKHPFDYVVSGGWKTLESACVHRTFFENDLAYYCKGLAACYRKYGSLERIFSSAWDIFDGIAAFRREMALANAGPSDSGAKKARSPGIPVYSKHIADPDAGSACKRINLALRWLVRRDGIVDLGIWKSISPSRLCIPLDVHAGRTARSLGLLMRSQDDRKAVEELTIHLRTFCPEDPVKYDFALFGIGIEGIVAGSGRF